MVEQITKQSLSEMRFILEGCRSGRLDHQQDVWHCGTSHCIAGWKARMDKAVRPVMGSELKGNFYDDDDIVYWEATVEGGDTGNYAQDKWGLSAFESKMLFDADATFREQFALLETLEAGYRLHCLPDVLETALNRLVVDYGVADEESEVDEQLKCSYREVERLLSMRKYREFVKVTKFFVERLIAYEYPKREHQQYVEHLVLNDILCKTSSTQEVIETIQKEEVIVNEHEQTNSR